MKEASFEYFFFGNGWNKGETVDEHKPTKRVSLYISYYYTNQYCVQATAICRGPDPGYIGTSACIVSAALSILEDKDKLPKQLV